MLLNVLQTKLYIVLSDAIMLHDIQRKAGSLNRGSLPLGFLLALIGSSVKHSARIRSRLPMRFFMVYPPRMMVKILFMPA